MAAILMPHFLVLYGCIYLEVWFCRYSIVMAGQGQTKWDRLQPEPIREYYNPNVLMGEETVTYTPQFLKNNNCFKTISFLLNYGKCFDVFFNHMLSLPNIVTINHLHVVDLPIKMIRLQKLYFSICFHYALCS